MSKPEIAAKAPCAVDVEKGKDYWWVRLVVGVNHNHFVMVRTKEANSHP